MGPVLAGPAREKSGGPENRARRECAGDVGWGGKRSPSVTGHTPRARRGGGAKLSKLTVSNGGGGASGPGVACRIGVAMCSSPISPRGSVGGSQSSHSAADDAALKEW